MGRKNQNSNVQWTMGVETRDAASRVGKWPRRKENAEDARPLWTRESVHCRLKGSEYHCATRIRRLRATLISIVPLNGVPSGGRARRRLIVALRAPRLSPD